MDFTLGDATWTGRQLKVAIEEATNYKELVCDLDGVVVIPLKRTCFFSFGFKICLYFSNCYFYSLVYSIFVFLVCVFLGFSCNPSLGLSTKQGEMAKLVASSDGGQK